ncbi:hypothetical protein O3P69_019347 [Scylla paramamosain]|uniref:Suppressor APC domain-containing protein 2 n=1 Tax=Scylla paramamosain TaxID=85552 RepID=A0AAW0SWC6_SCYPA
MLCRLKQLEAERDMLVQGCEVVERARVWYREQLATTTDRIYSLPHAAHKMEPTLETQQERLHFQLARIHEVNLHLIALMAVGGGGPPPLVSARQQEEQRLVTKLKEQNHQLTEEVSNKSERIAILEREKAALLRELFQPRPAAPLPLHHPLRAPPPPPPPPPLPIQHSCDLL